MNVIRLWCGMTLLCGSVAWAGPQDAVQPLGSSSSTTDPDDSDGSKMAPLFKMAGRWKIEEQYPAQNGADKGPVGKGDVIFKESLDDTVLIGDYRSKCKTLNTDVKGHTVFSYDADADEYLYFWFDNYGHAYRFTGNYEHRGRAFVFTRKNNPSSGSGILSERHTYRMRDKDRIVFTMEFETAPSSYELALTTTYLRKGTTRKGEEEEENSRPSRPSRGMLGR